MNRNYLVVQKSYFYNAELGEFDSKLFRKYYNIQMLDFVFLQTEPDSFDVYKNRKNGRNYESITWNMCEALMK